jgi:hypothetical protein
MDDTPRMKGKEIISVHAARYKIGMTGLFDMFKDFTERVFGFQDHQHSKRLTKPC